MRACSPTLGSCSLEAARTFWRHQLVQQSHSEDSSGKAQRGVARAGRRLLRGAGSTVPGGGGRGARQPNFRLSPLRQGKCLVARGGRTQSPSGTESPAGRRRGSPGVPGPGVRGGGSLLRGPLPPP